ncbi:hypothetical protein JRO89_XS03G0105900 [Xanthoceras sorbifolium]|uniref:HR-like lesion-inducer n=1 Tax=Xanthoceras sorbifolium TaxID=99658 RepID=A0ABQ8I9F3_9ROSI|nr:hypothetical protein JRO89_XS03G0105900 [Xanthoceras sorbifolium]
MAFASFMGRVLFASVFILSAWQEFNEYGVDGGPAAKALEPKFNIFSKHVSSQTGLQVPAFDIKYLVAAAIALKGLGSLLFILGSSLGAYLLLLHQAIATPILYDFYNYDADKKEYSQIFIKFTQVKLGTSGGIALFHWHEELNAKETAEEKGPKKQNSLRNMGSSPVQFLMVSI